MIWLLEKLSQEIRNAHLKLVEVSPDGMVATSPGEDIKEIQEPLKRSDRSFMVSSVMEKVKRRKTTMDALDMIRNRNVVKTYAGNNVIKGESGALSMGDEDTIFCNPKKRKAREDAERTEELDGPMQMKALKMKRRATTHGVVEETGDPSSARLISDKWQLKNALVPLSIPLVPSLSPKYGKILYSDIQHSASSTIPNTSIGSDRPPVADTVGQASSSARMTTPTTSGKAAGEQLTQSSDHINDALNYLADKENDISGYHTIDPAALTKKQEPVATKPVAELTPEPPARSSLSPTSATEPLDELSLPVFGQSASNSSHTSKPRCKLPDGYDSHADELGSDDITTGLPVEHYQPRPSRSRANHTVDDLVSAIDYSKRPEAVARGKGKIKRRKTDGDLEGNIINNERENLKVEETEAKEAEMEGNSTHVKYSETGVETILGIGQGFSAAQFAHTITGDRTVIERPTSDVMNTSGIMEEAGIEEDPPKRKRGRPKKQVANVPESEPEEKRLELSAMLEQGPPKLIESTTTVKKTRRRKKTGESALQISEEFATELEESAPTSDLSEKILEPNLHIANILPGSTTKDFSSTCAGKEATPAPALAPAIETPKKPPAKGSGKHSPLNSGKVPYRVGLSKNARIEPLLRMVRK